MVRVLIQNVGGASIDKKQGGGGSIAGLKISVHMKKPDVAILTETRIESREYRGKNIFQRLRNYQHSSTGLRQGGVMVFVNRQWEVIEQSIYNSGDGTNTFATYIVEGKKIMVVGIYGPAGGSDAASLEVFKKIEEKMREMSILYRPQVILCGGDFNVHLDLEGRKARTCEKVRSIIEEFNLTDWGAREGKETWRRPGKSKIKSRIDYILTAGIGKAELCVRWGKKDHAEIVMNGEIKRRGEFRGQDWVIASERFKQEGREIIKKVMIDHSREFLTGKIMNREEYEKERDVRQIEEELTLHDLEEGVGHVHVLQVILQKIKGKQKEIQKENARNRSKRIENLQKELETAYKKIDEKNMREDEEGRIESDIRDIKRKIESEAESIKNEREIRIKNIWLDKEGKNNTETFMVIREGWAKGGINRIINEQDEEITDEEQINIILEEKYRNKVGQEHKAEMELEEFMQKYKVELERIEEQDKRELDNEYSEMEIKEAVKDAKVKSAPGPMGHTAALFRFLAAEAIGLLTRAMNELSFVPGLIDSASNNWVKNRYIRYIPKEKGNDRVDKMRPINLLESMYKIQSRILAKRMMKVMEKVLSKNQHGFVSNRSCQTAIIPILEAINEAERHGKPLQIISIDITAAFDSLDQNTVKKVMLKQGYPEIYVEAISRITDKGTAQIKNGKEVGKEVEIKSGSGQGDPLSSPKYVTGTDPSIRAVENVTREYRYKFNNGKKLPPNGFADDNALCTQVTEARQVKEIFQVYEDYGKVAGVRVNERKSEILAINTPIELINEIQRETGIRVVTKMRYLGIQLVGNYDESKIESYENIKSKIESKIIKIQKRNITMFHKRRLINVGIIPMFNHIAMVFGEYEKFTEWISKKMTETLWYKKRDGEVVRGRNLIARKRLTASFDLGGLQMIDVKSMAEGLLLNYVQKNINDECDLFYWELHRGYLQTIGIYDLKTELDSTGPRKWRERAARVKVHSTFLSKVLYSVANLLECNEKSKEGWFKAAIIGHSKSEGLIRFSTNEAVELERKNMIQIQDLYEENEITGKRDPKKLRNFGEIFGQENGCLIEKSKILGRSVSEGKRVFQAKVGTVMDVIGKGKWSKIYRRFEREKVDEEINAPPSFNTRRREGYAIPQLHEYMEGYRCIIKAKVPVRTMECNFLIMNRQIWTNLKGKYVGERRGEEVNDKCTMCDQVENTFHILMECEEYSSKLWDVFCKEVGSIIGMRLEKHAFFMMYGQKQRIKNEWQSIIQEITFELNREIIRRRMTRIENTNLNRIKLDERRAISHIMIVIEGMLGLKRVQGKKSKKLEEIYNGIQALLQA